MPRPKKRARDLAAEAEAAPPEDTTDLVVDEDGLATISTLCAIPGAGARAIHRCDPTEATRLIRSRLAHQPKA